MDAQMIWLTLEVKVITDILSGMYQQSREDALYSTKIRAIAEPIHNYRVLVGSCVYPNSYI